MSTRKKLTPRQLKVLESLTLPGNRAVYHPWGSYYVVENDSGYFLKNCTRQINALIDCGFVRTIKWLDKQIATISAEGEKYLEENLLIKGKGTKLNKQAAN